MMGIEQQKELPEQEKEPSQGWGVKAWVLLGVVLVFAGSWLWHNWGVFYDMFGTYPNPLHTNEYKLIDSGMWGPFQPTWGWAEPIYWIDNETILFSSPVVTEADKEPGSGVFKKFKAITPLSHDIYILNPNAQSELFVWKLGEKPRPYVVRLRNRVSFCADDGIVKYQGKDNKSEIGDDGKYYGDWIVGPLGQEKPEKVSITEYGRGILPVNENFCSNKKSDERMKGRAWAVSARGDYYLDMGDRKAIENNKYIAADGAMTSSLAPVEMNLMKSDLSEKVALDIPFNEVTYYLTFSEKFDNAFYLWRGAPGNPEAVEQWKREGCLPVWKIGAADKKTERFCIPYNDTYAWSSIKLLPTKAGLFFIDYDVERIGKKTGPLSGGIYKYDAREPKRVLSGLVINNLIHGGSNVSPDGCKIAFGHLPLQDWYHLSQLTNRTLKVLDLCSNSKSEGDKK